MKYRKLVSLGLIAAALASGGAASAALNLEGQSGVFLNSLAYTLPANAVEASGHYVDLDGLGNVSTYSVAVGVQKGFELGFTQVASTVNGVKDQTLLLAKYQAVKETKEVPAVSAWLIHRGLNGGETSDDLGISATKVVTAGKRPLVLDLGARSTKAVGLGLFGMATDRKIKFEGSVAWFITPKFAAGGEFKQQIGGRTWRDIAFRYIANKHINIDAGLANLGPSIDNQLALAVTYSK